VVLGVRRTENSSSRSAAGRPDVITATWVHGLCARSGLRSDARFLQVRPRPSRPGQTATDGPLHTEPVSNSYSVTSSLTSGTGTGRARPVHGGRPAGVAQLLSGHAGDRGCADDLADGVADR
jgi:hypothetical protein